jgi:hypothetical protein
VAAKASDADASAAEAVKSSSAKPATERGSAETTDPAAETANRTTPEATPRPTATEAAAAKPATMPSGEPTAAVTTATTTVTTTAAAVTTTTAAVTTTAAPTREGINRCKSDCSTDDGGDGNSDDCFFKHGKSPLERPPRQNQP